MACLERSIRGEGRTKWRRNVLVRDVARNKQIYLMLIPVIAYYVIFHYIPMYGAQIAFRNYSPLNGIRYAKCLLFNQICVGLKVLEETGLRYSDIFGSEPVDMLMRSESLEGTLENVLRLFQDICEHVNRSKGARSERMKEQLMEYIDQHYADPLLSQTGIAEHFDITPQYLSKLFKQSTGENMLDYLNFKRVECAKQLLQDISIPIGEIAERVGLTNTRNLNRVFKRYEGVSPSAYRDVAGRKPAVRED